VIVVCGREGFDWPIQQGMGWGGVRWSGQSRQQEKSLTPQQTPIWTGNACQRALLCLQALPHPTFSALEVRSHC
jgi:hypothetical protein